ncbi:MAG: ECF transporter S component [Oscillospiraceae bacterium]|jgi:thiamine transporter ThiT|nr:ECF transporter S component [Oscillospiraceae bacterium]
MAKASNKRVFRLVQLALLTATTIVLTMLPIKIGAFQFALALTPIVIGAAALGPPAGAWLGAVFGAMVLLNGDAALFLAFSVPRTVFLVLLKGSLAGLCAGAVYRALERRNKTAAAILASVLAPVANTGVFALGGYTLFADYIKAFPATMPDFFGSLRGQSLGYILFIGLIGVNFFVELGINTILSGAVVRILRVWRDRAAA